MAIHTHQFEFEILDNESALNNADLLLLRKAKEATELAYAPYSNFHVAAVARLANGAIVAATNQENASYPVGICAERTLLSTLSSLHPSIPVDTIVITYQNLASGHSNKPATPCGLCRQSLLEYQQRMKHPIRLILAGFTGHVLILERADHLLPFGFGPDDLSA